MQMDLTNRKSVGTLQNAIHLWILPHASATSGTPAIPHGDPKRGFHVGG